MMKKLVSLLVIVSLLLLLPNANILASSQSDGGGATKAAAPYSIATISANGAKKIVKSFSTFAAANKSFSTKASNQVILFNNRIIKMNSGIVVANSPNGITHAYPNASMSKHFSGVSTGNELEYVSSDDKAIQVKLAGQVAYVNYREAYLLPSVVLGNKRSYYQVDASRNLLHNVYNDVTKKRETYFYGVAPVGMKAGTYYSWDGINFTAAKGGAKVGPVYQYFNALPLRTVTKYSATELDSIIMKRLQQKEAESKKNKNTKFLNATKKSKLIGLGTTLKQHEQQYRVNALIILAIAMHESEFGMSNKAQTTNNLFGIGVYDENPMAGKKYNTPKDSVTALVNAVLNEEYMLPADGGYANGAFLGNKYRGVNVRYAMDQYWGQKVAGHLYTLDRDMGGKDFVKNAKPYALYRSTTDRLNVRETPEVINIPTNKIYGYLKPGYIFAVLSSEKKADGYTWNNIISEQFDTPSGYVVSADQGENVIQALRIAK